MSPTTTLTPRDEPVHQWVAEGCRLDRLLLGQEHAALVRAYAALLTAKLPQRDAMPPSGTGSRSRTAAAVLTLRGLAWPAAYRWVKQLRPRR
jgi:hypothetical protein